MENDNIISELNLQLKKLEQTLQERCKVFEKMSKDYDIIAFEPKYRITRDTLYQKITMTLEQMHNLNIAIALTKAKLNRCYENRQMSLDVSLIAFTNSFLVT